MTTNILESEYPSFAENEVIKIEFLNHTIVGKFLKWKPKGDRPFGYFLYLEQDYDNYIENLKKALDDNSISSEDFKFYKDRYEEYKNRSLNDQYIHSINGKPFKCFPQ